MAELPRDNPVVPTVASGHVFLLTFGAILVAIFLFLVLDLSLAKVEREQGASHAANLYLEGTALLAAGHTRDAIDRFDAAHAVERDSAVYALALGQAILADGRPQAAEESLQPVLERYAMDGAANLAMARVLLRERRLDEATAYYHRAIYGRWPVDSEKSRTQARFELIGVLESEHRQPELLAELLPLQDASTDTAFRLRLGALFLIAKSPLRAADIYRGVLHDAPGDPAAYAGLGEALLALGHFRAARADLRLARERSKGDPRIDSLSLIADSVVAMDPEDARLDAAARFRRSVDLLRRSVSFVSVCAGAAGNPSMRAMADSSEALSRSRVPAANLDRQGDTLLAFDERVWRMRPPTCAPITVQGRALALLHTVLAQR